MIPLLIAGLGLLAIGLLNLGGIGYLLVPIGSICIMGAIALWFVASWLHSKYPDRGEIEI